MVEQYFLYCVMHITVTNFDTNNVVVKIMPVIINYFP